MIGLILKTKKNIDEKIFFSIYTQVKNKNLISIRVPTGILNRDVLFNIFKAIKELDDNFKIDSIEVLFTTKDEAYLFNNVMSVLQDNQKVAPFYLEKIKEFKDESGQLYKVNFNKKLKNKYSLIILLGGLIDIINNSIKYKVKKEDIENNSNIAKNKLYFINESLKNIYRVL